MCVWVNNFQASKIQAVYFITVMILHMVLIGVMGELNIGA